MTPGRLAKYGLYALGAWIAVTAITSAGAFVVGSVVDDPDLYFLVGLFDLVRAISVVLLVAAGLLLLAAGAAKVIQIGVSSAKD